MRDRICSGNDWSVRKQKGGLISIFLLSFIVKMRYPYLYLTLRREINNQ